MGPMRLIGIALFVLGLGLAGVGIAGVGEERGPVPTGASAVGADDEAADNAGSGALIAVLSGLSLAAGAVLFGLSLGNWKNPRVHHEPGDEVVDPEGHQKMKHV